MPMGDPGNPIGGPGRNPIGAPFGRQTQWGREEEDHGGHPGQWGQEDYGDYYGGGGCGGCSGCGPGDNRRSQWDDRGPEDHRSSWDERAPGGCCGGGGDYYGDRRDPWDDRGPSSWDQGRPPDRGPPQPDYGRGSAAPRPPDRPASRFAGSGRGDEPKGPLLTLLVTGLAGQTTERDLGQLFEQAGLEVEFVHISVDRETGQTRGHAYVDIICGQREDPEVVADFAIHRLNGTELCGRPITVEVKGQESNRGPAPVPVPGYSGPGKGYPPAPPMGKGGGLQSVFSSAAKGYDMGKGGMMAAKPLPRKVVMCSYWKENRCTKGSMCSFAHGEHELQQSQAPPPVPVRPLILPGGKGPPPPVLPHPSPTVFGGMGAKGPGPPVLGMAGVTPPPPANRKTQLCAYYKEGRCTRGFTCNYAHGEHELLTEIRIAGRPPLPPRPGPTGGRFEARGAREIRGSSRDRERQRSPRRMKGVSFVKYGLAPAADRSECVVHGAPPPRERGTAAPSAINGSVPLATEGKQEKDNDDDEVKEVKEVEEVDVDAEDEKKEAAKKAAPPVVTATGPKVASFLLSEEGVAQLEDMYGLGLKLLRSMGWCPGRGVGSNDDGELEPVSVELLERPSTHYGRKDRRCLGRRKPKRFRDSDESSPSRTPSSSSSRSSSKSSRESSKSSSRSRKNRRKRRRPTKRRKKSRSKSSSRSSSSSSSSSSKDKKRKARKKGFTSTAPSATEAAAAAGAAAAQHIKMPPAPAPEVVVKEDPETAIAKKRVLAKLTELQKVEPKEQRAKEFRALLRDWHPDKNPEKKEMATAVFQFLQKGKSLLNLK